MDSNDTPREVGSHDELGPMTDGAHRALAERAAFEAWMAAATFESLGSDWHWSAWEAGAAWERAQRVAAQRTADFRPPDISSGMVKLPTSAAEAKAMATVAIAWLRLHAPNELRPEFGA